MEITWAIFHAEGYLSWANDSLNIILSGFAIFSGDNVNILWLMWSDTPHWFHEHFFISSNV
jgi:hypothetical protein